VGWAGRRNFSSAKTFKKEEPFCPLAGVIELVGHDFAAKTFAIAFTMGMRLGLETVCVRSRAIAASRSAAAADNATRDFQILSAKHIEMNFALARFRFA
jgi:hypothetical protein